MKKWMVVFATRETFTTQVQIWVGPVDKVSPASQAPRENGFR